MAGAREAQHLHRRLHRIEVLEDQRRIDHLVGLALRDDPPAGRAMQLTESEASHWRRDADQQFGAQVARHARRHIAAEGEAGQPERGFRHPSARLGDHRRQVIALAVAVVEDTGRAANAAEVEADRRRPGVTEGALEHRHDLVVHRPAMQRVGMADHGDQVWRGLGRADDGFDRAGGARQGETLGGGRPAGREHGKG